MGQQQLVRFRDVRNAVSRAWHLDFFPKTSTAICQLLALRLRCFLENGNHPQVLGCYRRAMLAQKKHSSARVVRTPAGFEPRKLSGFPKGQPEAYEENPAPQARGRAHRCRTGAIDRVFDRSEEHTSELQS